MAVIKSFKDMIVWQKAMALVNLVYDATDKFPKYERFALCDQLIRAVVSVPSNIAEGFGRLTDKDFAHFLAQARGSLYETETQLLVAENRKSIASMSRFSPVIDEVGRMLNSLISKLTTGESR